MTTKTSAPRKTRDTSTASAPIGQMAQHTPGPWEVEIPVTSHDAVVTNDADWSIATVHGAGKKAVAHLHAEGVANALLIAAAPDLLEACLEFIRKCETGCAKSMASYGQMKAAIAKAEGKSARSQTDGD